MRNHRFSKGFSLVELLVVIGVFTVVVGAFFGAGRIALQANRKAGEKVQAAFLLEEGIEAAKFLRDLSWKTHIKTVNPLYGQCARFDGVGGYDMAQQDNMLLYHMDEPAGSTALVDSSRNGVNASLPSSPTFGDSDTPGSGYGTSFSRTHTQSSAMTNLINDVSIGDFTVSIWAKSNANYGWPGSIWAATKVTGGWMKVFRLYQQPIAVTKFAFEGPSSVALSDPTTYVYPQAWHHFVVSRKISGSNSTYTMYVDGAQKQKSTVSDATLYPIRLITIGGYMFDDFPGWMDEFAFYTRALDEKEIFALFKYNMPACGIIDGKFLRSIKFQNVCRSAAADIVGSANGTDCSAYPGSTLDADTKKATTDVRWGDALQHIASMEAYIANLFLDE